MKKLFFCLSWMMSLQLFAQEFILDKKMDSLFVGEKDTIVNVTFKLKGLELRSEPKVSIKVNSGTAKQGTDFVLLDAYNAKTSEIFISRVENLTGSFKILIAGGLTESKYINLQIWINNNGRLSPDITKIIIAPPSKKPTIEPEKKPDQPKNDSLVFEYYNDIEIPVYTIDTGKRKEYIVLKKVFKKAYKRKKAREEEKSEIDDNGNKWTSSETVNIWSVEIVQCKSFEYQIKITTTDNTIYTSIIELTTDLLYKDDRLYLSGQKEKNYIKASDIFLLFIQKKDEKPSTTKNPIYKFKL